MAQKGTTMNGKYISRHEAAEMLGVSLQTVSNYIDRGLFKCRKIDGHIYILKKDFEEYKEKLVEAIDNEQTLARYNEELKQQIAESEANLKKFKEVNADLTTSVRKIRTRTDVLHNLMVEYADQFFKLYATDKQQWRMDELKTMTVQEFAEGSGKNADIVSGHLYVAVRDMVNRVKFDCFAKSEIDKLNVRNLSQHAYIKELEGKIAKYELCKKPDETGAYIDPMKYDLLNTNIDDIDLTLRTLNCLKAAEIETLGELIAYNKTDLLKFRNFGKKSLTELDNLLEELGLSFGTDVDLYLRDIDTPASRLETLHERNRRHAVDNCDVDLVDGDRVVITSTKSEMYGVGYVYEVTRCYKAKDGVYNLIVKKTNEDGSLMTLGNTTQCLKSEVVTWRKVPNNTPLSTKTKIVDRWVDYGCGLRWESKYHYEFHNTIDITPYVKHSIDFEEF